MSSVKITRISAYLLLIVVLLSVFSSGILGLALYQFNDDPVFYEPGLLVERYFEIHAADKDVKIWLDGPLSEYATVSKEILEEDSADRGFTVTLNFPYGADVTPGNYKIYVHTDEVTEERAGTFGTSVNILNGIRVLVIHPGKFLKIESYKIENVNVGETLNMGVWVSAFSQQDIDSAWAVFEIFDKDGNKMAEEATQRSTVKSRETVGLEAQTSTEGYEPGPYTAKITAFYEEGQSEAETSFQVGTLNVDILDYPTEFEARTINPFPMTIKSRWNDGIEDVYGELEIEGEKFSTPTIDLGGWKETTLEGFFDASGFEVGEYPMKVRVYYQGLSKEIDDIAILKEPTTVPAEEEAPSGIGFGLAIALVGIILLIVILDIIIMKRIGKKKEKKSE